MMRGHALFARMSFRTEGGGVFVARRNSGLLANAPIKRFDCPAHTVMLYQCVIFRIQLSLIWLGDRFYFISLIRGRAIKFRR